MFYLSYGLYYIERIVLLELLIQFDIVIIDENFLFATFSLSCKNNK